MTGVAETPNLLTNDSADGEICNISSTDTIDSQTLAELIRGGVRQFTGWYRETQNRDDPLVRNS